MNLQPRIYVACLAAYNNGYHHGAWLDINDELEANIEAIIKSSPCEDAEEWAIHDHEGMAWVDENEDLEALKSKAEFVKEHGLLGSALLDEFSGCLEDAERCMENYHGSYKSEAEFAEHIFDECHAHDFPKGLRFYFDFELFARDLFLDGYRAIWVNDDCHVFSDF